MGDIVSCWLTGLLLEPCYDIVRKPRTKGSIIMLVFYSPTQGSPKTTRIKHWTSLRKQTFGRLLTPGNKLSINLNLSAGIQKIMEQVINVNAVLVFEFLVLRPSSSSSHRRVLKLPILKEEQCHSLRHWFQVPLWAAVDSWNTFCFQE